VEQRCVSHINCGEQPDYRENRVLVIELVEKCYREGVWRRSVTRAVKSKECVC
jgi:hypothetical protein